MVAWNSLPSQLDQRRRNIAVTESVAGGNTRYTAIVSLSGVGEGLIPLMFPCTFTQKPVFYWGAEVDPSSLVADGSYPVVAPLVRNWLYRVQPTGDRWYAGASMLVVVSGLESQSLIMQFHFEARALSTVVPG